jgi:hypothetical protein
MVTDKEERDRTGGARSPASSAMMKMGRMQRWLLLHPRPAGFSLSPDPLLPDEPTWCRWLYHWSGKEMCVKVLLHIFGFGM